MLFACKPYADTFARPYVKALGCDVLITHSPEEVHRADSDVIWLEWASAWTRKVLEKRLNAFTIVRVIDWEVRTGLVKSIDWHNADLIWFINRQTRKDFYAQVETDTPSFFLPVAIEDVFECVAEDSRHLAMLSASLSPRKRYERAIELLSLLPDYQLTIRAQRNREYEKLDEHAKSLGVQVHFDFRPWDVKSVHDKTDVQEFFRGKSHVLSTSDHEGFHVAIGEGMLCGLSPVVYDWEWGRAKDFWHPYVCGSLEEMAEQIKKTKPSPEHAEYVRRLFAPEKLARGLLKQIEKHGTRMVA